MHYNMRGQQRNGGCGSGDGDSGRWCIIPFSQSVIHLCGKIINSENIIVMFTKGRNDKDFHVHGNNQCLA